MRNGSSMEFAALYRSLTDLKSSDWRLAWTLSASGLDSAVCVVIKVYRYGCHAALYLHPYLISWTESKQTGHPSAFSSGDVLVAASAVDLAATGVVLVATEEDAAELEGNNP